MKARFFEVVIGHAAKYLPAGYEPWMSKNHYSTAFLQYGEERGVDGGVPAQVSLPTFSLNINNTDRVFSVANLRLQLTNSTVTVTATLPLYSNHIILTSLCRMWCDTKADESEKPGESGYRNLHDLSTHCWEAGTLSPVNREELSPTTNYPAGPCATPVGINRLVRGRRGL
ncbi:hypothetical protein RRG08_029117 [Elysia crispata]|uniref:Uncharacterized protein n=1 Tax=Elysia crispata TaxID=231223 RepID=A0AAE0Y660_9GAST|nr:hypothetical protein RRG08_029117 [Elysia crispata]